MTNPKQIYIVGQPGAGKALLAQTLATKLGRKFINVDFGIETLAGETLESILGPGQEHFLRYQLKILTELSLQNDVVINTDPSIVCSQSNREFLSSQFVVYLDVNIQTQLIRMSRNSASIFSEPSFLEKLHTARDPLYAEIATIIINTNDNKLEQHIDIIKSSLENLDAHSNPEAKFENAELILFNKLTYKPIHLTKQQARCVKLLSQGKSSKEIGKELGLSYRSVETYLAKVMELTDCENSKELLTLYLKKYI